MNCIVLGCRLKISFCFIALVAAMLIIDHSGAMIWGMIAAILHELGHIFAMALQGGRPNEIRFGLFDIAIIDAQRKRNDYLHDAFVLLAGPFVNFLAGIIFYALFVVSKVEFMLIPAWQNLFLGLMNILPIESLDGGQILFALLCRKKVKNPELIVQVLSFIALLPLASLGFYILLCSKYNFSLLMVSCYLMAVTLLKRNRFY